MENCTEIHVLQHMPNMQLLSKTELIVLVLHGYCFEIRSF